MRALAQILNASGHRVSGSDRFYDQGMGREEVNGLLKEGISLFPQNGDALIVGDVDRVVISSAIEDENPELILARRKGIPVIKRAQLLAELTNRGCSIGVAGTSGKTTTCGMIGYLLRRLNKNPTIINGGVVLNFEEEGMIGDAVLGSGDLIVFEVDESDGLMELYRPKIGLITNIEFDHKPIPELVQIFSKFARNVRGKLVLNHRYMKGLSLDGLKGKTFSFGLECGDLFPHEYSMDGDGIEFKISNISYRLPLLGLHNLMNAVAAISVLKILGFMDEDISMMIKEFKGIRGRLELVGEGNGIRVYNDYAHNPDKIYATITTLQPYFERLIIIFQPHGYGPTRLLGPRLIDLFSENLRDEDILFVQKIYYAGGKVEMDISSEEIVIPLKRKGKRVFYSPCRDEVIGFLVKEVREGDAVVVMGARDRTLEGFAKGIAKAIL